MKKILSVILCTALLVSSVLSASFVSAEGKVNSYTGTVNDLNTVKNVYNDIASNTQDDFTGNVALGKTATASGSESDVWTPDKAVDGDKTSADSRWASARVYNVTPIVPQWIALDLEKEVTNITDITLTFDKLAWSTNFDIQTRASEDDEWVTVKNVTSDSGTEQNKVFTINDVTELDRYVRFYFNELNSSAAWGTISIKEIEINGTQSGGDDSELVEVTGNVAQGKNATASASESSTWTPDKTVDGDKETADSRWSSGRTMRNDPVEPQWLELDLKTNVTDITEVKVYFNAKVWATKYQIQTRASVNDEWRTVKDISVSASDETNKIDTFTDITELDRYVRFYFTEINSKAVWDAISVKEIEIYGTQLIDPNAPASAAEIMNKITSLPELTVDSTSIELPQVHSDYKIFIKGSEVKNVISLDNEVTPYNIGDRDVSVIVRVENKENAEDYAEKSFVVTVPDKTAEFPNIYPPVENPNEEPAVIPNIQEWYGYTGNFTITSDTRIVYNDEANLGIAKVAENLKEDLLDAYGLDLQVVAGTDGNQNDIYIEAMTDDTYDVGDEGYFMITNHLGLKIYAPGYTGAYYGTVTLEQILFQDNTLDVPMGVIRDYPNYEIRGVMIDIARAPYRIQMLKDYEKMLSWYKINEVHLHINDNIHNPNGDVTSYEHWKDTEGYFRLESETFPSLTSTAKSNEYYNESMGGTPSYTKEEWKDLQTYGMDFGVDTITEIDIPGHSLALTKYVYENADEAAEAGITGPVNSTRNWELLSLEDGRFENSLKMVKLLFEEYLDEDDPTFLSDTVHIGIDEYWNIQSNESANMVKLIDELKALLESKGKTVRVWAGLGSYTGSNISNYTDVEMDCWATSWDNPFQRLSDGFKIINVDQPIMYNNPGRNNRDIVNVEWMYENWDPTVFAVGKITKGEPGLLGAKTACWADVNLIGITEKDCDERIIRAAAVTSEKTWGGVRADDTYEEYELTFSKLRDKTQNTDIAMNVASQSNLVMKYDFENVSGDVVYDMSGNGYDASIVNGGAVEDGMMTFTADTKITTPLKTISYPYTVTFDIEVGEGNGDNSAILEGYDGRLSVKEDGTLRINRSYFEQTFGNYKLNLNEKHNVTIVGTQQATKLYVDGVLVKHLGRASASETDYENLATTFVLPVTNIGGGFVGKLGNFEVYNKAFSPELINAIAKGTAYNKVNVAQDKGVAGDGQTVGMGNYDVDWKKIRVGWKATDGDGFALDGSNNVSVTEIDSFFEGNYNGAFLTVDLFENHEISEVVLQWDRSPQTYKIQVSTDGKAWTDVKTVTYTDTNKKQEVITLDTPVTARYVKMQGVSLLNGTTFKLREFMVFENVDKTSLAEKTAEAEALMNKLGVSIVDKGNYQELVNSYIYAKAMEENPMAEANNVNEALTALESAIEDASSVPEYKLGDVDHNGTVDVNDVTLIQKYLTRMELDVDFFVSEADINSSNSITVLDATLIQIMLVEK